jgi:hypothetical protein
MELCQLIKDLDTLYNLGLWTRPLKYVAAIISLRPYLEY